VYADISDYMK